MQITEVRRALGAHEWAERIELFDTVDSTNTEASRRAALGAPEGTIIIASRQTGGRGRQGRAFASPAGGVYLSIVLRPNIPVDALGPVTLRAALAAVDAVEQAAGVRPQIKWTNDLILGMKKLGGILTELSVAPDGTVEHLIVGVGINVRRADFDPSLQAIATSLEEQTGSEIAPEAVAAALIRALHLLAFPGSPDDLARYRAACVTLGHPVKIVRGSSERFAFAEDLAPDGALLVRYEDGSREAVTAGDVSVRGLCGYV